MQVLIIPSWYFPKGSPDLHGRLFQQFGRDLREHHIDARIFFADVSPSGAFFGKHEFGDEDGVPTYRYSQLFFPKRYSWSLQMATKFAARALLRHIRSNGTPDVLHAQSYLGAFVGAEVSRTFKTPVIYSEHASAFLKKDIPKWQLPFFKKYFPFIRIITAVSPGLADVFRPHAGDVVRVVPNYFDETIFSIQQGVRKSSVFTWVSVGEPAHTKGLDILLRAFALLIRRHDVAQYPMKLVLVDDIKEKDALIRLAQSMRMDQHIEWKGVITPSELAKLLNESHALVSASRVETFGKTMMEAMACGLPVVATKTDGAKFIFGYSSHQHQAADTAYATEAGVLAEVNSVDSLVNAMGKLYHGYDAYEPHKICKRVESRFAKTKVIREWIALYKQILHDPD